jgi:hypothetical protein
MYKIEVVDQFHYQASVLFGLQVAAPAEKWPLVVGCSLRTPHGDIIDEPARRLSPTGLALWEIKASSEFKVGPHREDGGWVRSSLRTGLTTVFSLVGRYRLAPWNAIWMIGASTYGLDAQDERDLAKYGSRRDVWS